MRSKSISTSRDVSIVKMEGDVLLYIDGELVARMTMGEWSYMISHPTTITPVKAA